MFIYTYIIYIIYTSYIYIYVYFSSMRQVIKNVKAKYLCYHNSVLLSFD